MFNDKVVEDKKIVKKVLSDFSISEYFLRYEPRKLALFPVKKILKAQKRLRRLFLAVTK